MARNRERNLSWKYQISEELKGKLAIGESKLDAKLDGTYTEKIYSWETYRTYQKQLIYFSEFIKENHSDCKKIADITPQIVNNYLEKRMEQGNSPFTLKLITSSICKVTNIDRETLIKTPDRKRSGITRSRNGITNRFNEQKNKELVDFCKGTGVRRAELTQLRGTDLVKVGEKYYLNVTRNTKGGRERQAEITGNIGLIVELCNQAGENKIWEYVPKACPVHNYRADYCKSIYQQYAKHPMTIKKLARTEPQKVYKCRLDKKGIVYDREAMKIASENLGHSRVDVIATNYLN